MEKIVASLCARGGSLAFFHLPHVCPKGRVFKHMSTIYLQQASERLFERGCLIISRTLRQQGT
jgi:hypothetical protein